MAKSQKKLAAPLVEKLLKGYTPPKPRGRPRIKPLLPEKKKALCGPITKIRPDVLQHCKDRHLRGETITALAKEFKINARTLGDQISAEVKGIKIAANKALEADMAMQELGLSAKATALNLVEELKATSMHLASAAKFGAATAHRTAMVANKELERLNTDDLNAEGNAAIIRNVSGLTDLSNRAAQVGLNLLAANKAVIAEHRAEEKQINQEAIPNDPRDAAKAYMKLIGG